MGNTPTSGDESPCIMIDMVIAVTSEVHELLFNECEAGGSIHPDEGQATLVYMDRGVRHKGSPYTPRHQDPNQIREKGLVKYNQSLACTT